MMFFENVVSKPFDQPFYFVLQLGVGGPEFDTRNMAVQTSDAMLWHNNRFIVDYIKVYQDSAMISELNKLSSGSVTRSQFSWALCSCALLLIVLRQLLL